MNLPLRARDANAVDQVEQSGTHTDGAVSVVGGIGGVAELDRVGEVQAGHTPKKVMQGAQLHRAGATSLDHRLGIVETQEDSPTVVGQEGVSGSIRHHVLVDRSCEVLAVKTKCDSCANGLVRLTKDIAQSFRLWVSWVSCIVDDLLQIDSCAKLELTH
jgi:hypothetical protein